MRTCSIASGSSGNCLFVGSETANLLIDVGISTKRIEKSLETLQLKAREIDGILITHEHSDHIGGLGVFSRKYKVPMYATLNTIKAIKEYKKLGEIDYSLFHEITPDQSFLIKDITIEPSAIWHDAADPVCYSFTSNNSKISIATDLGNYDDYILSKLKDSDILFIEANHDIRMLEVGPYPYYLKKRILSDRGHLSNERSGQLIKALLNEHIKGITLGHLSKENNFAELAYETVNLELADNIYTKNIKDFNLQVAKRDEVSALLTC